MLGKTKQCLKSLNEFTFFLSSSNGTKSLDQCNVVSLQIIIIMKKEVSEKFSGKFSK